MSVLAVKIRPLVARTKPYPPGVGSAPDAVLQAGGRAAQELAQALNNIQARLDGFDAVLRQQTPVVEQIEVVDSTGRVIAALGQFIFAGVPATNYFSEIHVGDPLNTGDPSQALFNANPDGSVTIGQHGWLQVIDPYAADAAWIGTQFDTLPVTGAANNGSGLIRLTVTGHTLATGDVVQVRGVIGVTSATNGTSNANGTFTVTKIDANHIDLQSSVFVGAYTSGGTVDRLLHVTGAANNGSGLIRLTVTAHGYESGDRVNVQTVGGVPNATGQWTIAVITANTFDLVGSTFAGAYTSGGTALRYFAGMLAQTFAIGPSFSNYLLRGFADGTLKIRNAQIILTSTAGSIVLDPTVPSIVVTSATTTEVVTIDPISGIVQTDGTLTFQAFHGVAKVTGTTYFSVEGEGTFNVGRVATSTITARMDAISVDSTGGSVEVDSNAGAYKAGIQVIGGNGALCINGVNTQVVGPRLAAIAAPTISTSGVAAGPAPATYTAVAINMLDQLKAAVLALNTDVVNLQTTVNAIRDALRTGPGHGLTA